MKLKTFRFHDFRSRQILEVCLVLFSSIFIINCGGKYVPPVDNTAKSLGCAPAEKLTPATRADIIENLIAKGYAVRQGKSLRPSVKGIRLPASSKHPQEC